MDRRSFLGVRAAALTIAPLAADAQRAGNGGTRRGGFSPSHQTCPLPNLRRSRLSSTPRSRSTLGFLPNLSTLGDVYLFSASGFNIIGGVAQPKAVVELIRFNGDGTLTGGPATASINGTITRSPAGGLGSYTVATNCTGALDFGPPTHFTYDFF